MGKSGGKAKSRGTQKAQKAAKALWDKRKKEKQDSS